MLIWRTFKEVQDMNKPILGTIYLVSDLATAAASREIPQTFVISLTEQQDYIISIPDAMAGTVFLPPYEAMMFLSDGDFNNFRDNYLYYLASSEQVNLLFTVLCTSCLMKDSHLIFYVPKEELDLGFFGVLAEYIMNCFGIVIGTPQNPFVYNPAFDASNLQKMYINSFIDLQELMVHYPVGSPFDPQINDKIADEMQLRIQMSEWTIPQWIFEYKERIKQNNNIFLQRGVIIDASIRKGQLL